MSVIITLAGNLNNTSFLCVWSRAHLLTTLRAVVLPDGSRALDQGDAPADCTLLVAPSWEAVKSSDPLCLRHS